MTNRKVWDRVSLGSGRLGQTRRASSKKREGGRTTHVFARDCVDDIVGWRAQKLRDDGELVHVVLAGEERLALEHLGEDAARAPYVDLDVVLLPGEHNLGSPVVTSRHVTSHLGVLDARQPKVTDLQVAVLVHQDVAGLQITVDDSCRVHVFQAPHDLVKEVLDELLLEGARRQEPVKVGTQEFRDEIPNRSLSEKKKLQARPACHGPRGGLTSLQAGR